MQAAAPPPPASQYSGRSIIPAAPPPESNVSRRRRSPTSVWEFDESALVQRDPYNIIKQNLPQPSSSIFTRQNLLPEPSSSIFTRQNLPEPASVLRKPAPSVAGKPAPTSTAGKIPAVDQSTSPPKARQVAVDRSVYNLKADHHDQPLSNSDRKRAMAAGLQAIQENAVVVVSSSSSACAMSQVMRKLLCSLGVSPIMVELDDNHDLQQQVDLAALIRELEAGHNHQIKSKKQRTDNRSSISKNDQVLAAGSDNCQIPAVFIGGRLLGGVDTLLTAHITGTLVPRLKEAGALWL